MQPTHHARGGFTLVELLVVIAIIAILVMLLLPAINAVRGAARRAQCTNNLVQLIVGVQNYEQAHEVYPPGTIDSAGPIQNQPIGYHHSWLVQLLPYIEEKAAYRHVDRSVGVYHNNNKAVRQLRIGSYECPSSYNGNSNGPAWTNYAGVHHDIEAPIDADNHGVFYLNSRIRYEDISDGLSQTLFIGEKLADDTADLGWMSGTRASLRNTGTPINETGKNASGIWVPMTPQDERQQLNYSLIPEEDALYENKVAEDADEGAAANAAADGAPREAGGTQEEGQLAPLLYVGGFGSEHAAGANFAFGSGRVIFLTDDVDQDAYQQMGHRADGKLLSAERMNP